LDTEQVFLDFWVSNSFHIVYRLVACKQVLEETQGKVLQVVFSLSLLALLTKESMFQLFHGDFIAIFYPFPPLITRGERHFPNNLSRRGMR